MRDGDYAANVAEQICKLTKYKEPQFLDTLAVTHAEAGNFNRAIKAARLAIKLHQDRNSPESEITPLRVRLQGFRKQEPFRDKF